MMQLSPIRMKTSFLAAFTAIVCLTANLHGWQTASLSGFDKNYITHAKNDDKIMKMPGSILLEHAMHDYKRTYNQHRDFFLELSFDPFFEYDFVPQGPRAMVMCEQRRFWSAGVFAQAHMQYKHFWIHAYDMIGKIKESCHRADLEAQYDNMESLGIKVPSRIIPGNESARGADDAIIKMGYNFYESNKHRCALYALGGIPTHRNVDANIMYVQGNFPTSPASKIKNNSDNYILTIKSPAMGSNNFRIGGGFNGAFTVYTSANNHVAFLCDIQYSYAFPSTFIDNQDWTSASKKTFVTIWPQYLIKALGKINYAQSSAKFTPGHSIDSWFALHYRLCNWGFELGSVVSTMFGKKAEFKFNNDEFNKLSTQFKWLTPEIINFGVQPYIACSYNVPTRIGDFDLGLGAGYEYGHTTRKKLPNTFQGLNVWSSASLTF